MASYKRKLPAKDVDFAISAAYEMSQTAGLVRSNGRGGVVSSAPGVDYGYPLLTGNGTPTAFTPGSIGQHYFDVAAEEAPYEYICVDNNEYGYVWQAIGSGGGFRILGYYATLDELKAAVVNPTPGDAYGVGADGVYDIYVYDGTSGEWLNNGALKGEAGLGVLPHGDKGQFLGKKSGVSYDTAWLDIAKQVDAIPTEYTAPDYIGQIYVNTAATAEPYVYVCVGRDTTSGEVKFVWKPILLDFASQPFTASILAADWSGDAAPYTNAVSVPGVFDDDKPIIDIVPSDDFAIALKELDAWGYVYRAVTSTNVVTFYATEKPDIDMNVQLKAVRK